MQTITLLYAFLNLAIIGAILLGAALLVLARRNEYGKRKLIEGLEFRHELEPLAPSEPSDRYYLY